MASKAPRVGDVVTSRTLPACEAGFITETEGIHVWVRFFAPAEDEDGGNHDVYTRRDTLEVISRANSR